MLCTVRLWVFLQVMQFLNLAYETAAKAFGMEVVDARVARAFAVLAKKAGVYGMVGGQVVDVESEKTDDCPITREKA